MVPTKDFKPFIHAGMFVPICIPFKLYNLLDFLSDKARAPLISPQLMSSLPLFFFNAPSCTSLRVPGETGFICTETHVLTLFFCSCLAE